MVRSSIHAFDRILDYACLKCKSFPLIFLSDNLQCPACLTEYPVKNNIPVLLPNRLINDPYEVNIDQLEEIITIYNKAYEHDDIMGTDLDKIYDRETKKILLQFPESLERRRILDVGTGTGNLWDYIPENVQGYAIDPSIKGLIKVAKRKPDLTVSVSIGEYLPYPDRFFDVIIAADTIEHTLNPQRTLKEIHRTIKSKGDFCASFPIPNSLMKWGWNQIIHRKIGFRYFYQTIKVIFTRFRLFGNAFFQPIDRDLNIQQWQNLLESTGFNVIQVSEWPEMPEIPIAYLVHCKVITN